MVGATTSGEEDVDVCDELCLRWWLEGADTCGHATGACKIY